MNTTQLLTALGLKTAKTSPPGTAATATELFTAVEARALGVTLQDIYTQLAALSPPTTPTTLTPTYSNFRHSGTNPDVSGFVRPDALSEATLRTTATSITLNVTHGAALYVRNGSTLLGTYTGNSVISGLPTGSKDLIFNVGQQGRDYEVGEINFTAFQVTVPAGFTASWVTPPVTSEGIVSYGDSLTNGATTTIPGRDAYWPLIRAARGNTVYVMGYGSFIGPYHIDTPQKRADEAARVKARLLAHTVKKFVYEEGVNPYGFYGSQLVPASYTPTQMQTHLTAFLQLLDVEIPGLQKYVRTPATRVPEGANSGGFTLAQYRTAQENAASATNSVVIPGPTVFNVAQVDTNDGTHYGDAGNASAAAAIGPYLDQVPGTLFTTSSAQGVVLTATSPGGNGETARALTASSTAGEAVQWSFDNGVSWGSSNVFSLEGLSPSAATVTYKCRKVSNTATVVSNSVVLFPFYAAADNGGFTYVGAGWTKYPGLPSNGVFPLAYNDEAVTEYAQVLVPAGKRARVWGRKQPNTQYIDVSVDGGSKTPVDITGTTFDSNMEILYTSAVAGGSGLNLKIYRNTAAPALQLSYVQIIT